MIVIIIILLLLVRGYEIPRFRFVKNTRLYVFKKVWNVRSAWFWGRAEDKN